MLRRRPSPRRTELGYFIPAVAADARRRRNKRDGSPPAQPPHPGPLPLGGGEGGVGGSSQISERQLVSDSFCLSPRRTRGEGWGEGSPPPHVGGYGLWAIHASSEICRLALDGEQETFRPHLRADKQPARLLGQGLLRVAEGLAGVTGGFLAGVGGSRLELIEDFGDGILLLIGKLGVSGQLEEFGRG